MRIFRDPGKLGKIKKKTVVTLGNFDGVHLGHRKIIGKVRERAGRLGCLSAVYTFEPHPLKVVAPLRSPPLIIDTAKKAELVGALGIDYMVIARFTKEFASKHPREFVEEEIKPLGAVEVWVGHDFSFGRGKAGTVDYLKKLGSELGFSVHVISAYMLGGEVVSSSRIRRLVSEGKVGEAARLLGCPFSIKGRVVRGKAIGKEIGFPTANLFVESELVPAGGVYAAFATVGGRRLKAVLNIGTAPTFGGKKRCVEVHILGFRDDIYGKKVEVEFIRRLRGERAFASREALVRQIRKDAARGERILSRTVK
ncbi:MAG: riboflavin biosynthesis protein RibF [Deltaproteobacteria bacterium GWC2_55_46]|nr:MAG: riboflavin biosynthesis protein RibF [Deltaproteobacteria bacterium GWA2_55_82]OGQ62598.1 MAG: riboflavin biosynthesis protein RibF [Deltaproteobacteria bacterium RIFCSPLOWO2_02_FULL_55_12]OIJ74187.1 MAG: riboflavin biosynthesis protein RibF [Deltaproteobacteria bacterium GWC2_55_46]